MVTYMDEKIFRKINTEIEDNKNQPLAQVFGNYLIKVCSEDNNEELNLSLLSHKKSLSNCINYILNFARKNAFKNGGMSVAVFEDNMIYTKVIEYYLTENIAEDEVKPLGNTEVKIEIKTTENKISSEQQPSLFEEEI